MTDQIEFCAWGDESGRRLGPDESDPSVYLLGAAIIDMADYDTCRDALLALPRSGPKLHWHDADDRRRTQIMAVVDTLPAQHVVVIAAPMDPSRQERARAKCIERMLHELDQYGVTRLVMENRTQSLNKRDMRLIDRLRGSERVPTGIRLDFGLPSQEPLLWLPDQVLGALGLAESGDERWLSDAVRDRVERIDIVLG